MIKFRSAKPLLSFCLLSISLALPAHAQSAKEQREARIIDTARQSAQLAGGARFCRVDNETIDEFIGLTDARIAVLARDDYEKVLGKLEFKNMLTAHSAKMPKGGCETLIARFNAVMRNPNQR
ncbi:MAG: hypothetical protein AB3N28_05330 [Kordiimonas sp.]